MKKFIVMMSVALIMLSACRKDLIEPIDPNKKSKVSFKIGGLNHTVGQLNVGFPTEPIKNFISQLTIIAYDAQTGAEVMRETQLETSLSFGQISFQLPKGTYNFVAVGSNTLFGINQFYEGDKDKPVMLSYAEANFQYWQSSFSFQDRYYKTSDTFLTKKTGVVVNGDQQLDMIMQRIVGILDIVITDLPAFRIDLQNDYAAFRFDAGQAFGVMENDFGSGLKNSVDGRVSYYILRTDIPVTFEVRAGGVPREFTYISATVYKNKRTTITGKALTGEYVSTVN